MFTKDYKKISVENLEHKNQYLIKYNNASQPTLITYAFQSYATLIAYYEKNTKTLYINWSMFDYSKTTLKHLKLFINTYTHFTYNNYKDFRLLLLSKDSHIILFNE